MYSKKTVNPCWKTIKRKEIVTSVIFFVSLGVGFSQENEPAQNLLKLDLEIRPRAEFRRNFRLSQADSLDPELFVSQRHRLTLDFSSKHLDVLASFQEIHLFGKGGTPSTVANVGFYELLLQLKYRKFSARIGRQRLLLDNGRIFSDAPWAQQSRAHEGIRIFYAGTKTQTDFSWMFGRTYSDRFDPMYSPVASHRYKYMLLHHLKSRIGERFTLTTILALDSFEDEDGNQHERMTTGGRLEYLTGRNYFTVNAFLQNGKTLFGQTIHAYYLQPEFRHQIRNTTVRLGTEILSGDDLSNPSEYFKSFVPLYGVAWKFMGNMNFFTRFPTDVHSSGLVNPYLFILQRISSRLGARADSHLFFSQFPLVDSSKNQADQYLGSEIDLSLTFKPSPNWDLNFGLSFLFPTGSMVFLNKIKSATDMPVWSYLMVSFHPDLLKKTDLGNKK